MALWYVGSTKWTAVTAWAASTAYSVGDIRRQLAAPTAGNERVWRCTTAGTSGGSEPSWTLTKGSTTADNTAVWTEITGDENYNSPNNFAAPFFRLTQAMSWAAAGDTVYVSNNHAGTRAASVVYGGPGTAASPVRVLCIDDTQATATLATGATESATGTVILGFDGFAYYYGIQFKNGSGSASSGAYIQIGNSATTSCHIVFENCILEMMSTSTSAISQFGGVGSGAKIAHGVVLINTVLRFGAVYTRAWSVNCPTRWVGTASATTGSVPTSLFCCDSALNPVPSGDLFVHGVDLSALGSGKNWASVGGNFPVGFYFSNCKAGASFSFTTGSVTSQSGSKVRAVNCDSADTNYRYYYQDYTGTTINETVIVRTGGSSDGTTAFSRKAVTTANSKFFSPLILDPIVVWNETTGSALTATVEVITDNVTLTDAEAWLEVEYLGTSGYPLSLFASDRATNILSTPANQTTSSETWATTGLTTPVKQKLAVTFTPQEKGPIRLRVHVAKASTTVYVCQKAAVA